METIQELTKKAFVFQDFVDNRLLRDLRRVMDAQRKLEEEIKQYETLIESIDALLLVEQTKEPLITNIGRNIYATIKIDDPNRMYVNVGGEIFVEMSILEAINFCHEKIYYLRRMHENYCDKEIEIKTNIDLIIANLELFRSTLEDS